MSYTSNPMLLNPNNNGQPTVQPTAQPANSITQPLPVIIMEEPVFFTCSMLNHHMHRTDGKRLAFTFGVLESKDHYDAVYLIQEINSGNPFIRKSSEQEIDVYKMRTDPRGHMEKKLTPGIEEKVRVELEIELRNSLEAKLKAMNVVLSPEQLASLSEQSTASSKFTTDDEAKLAGTTALDRLKANVSVQSGSGTLILGGIQGTDKMANSADSNSGR